MRNKRGKTLRWITVVLVSIIIIGFLLPQRFSMPVAAGTRKNYAQNSFWFYPWGKSVTHKGVDIFAKKGRPVRPATPGIVIFTGKNRLGGNVVYVLGPKWRLHYYAHLDSIKTSFFAPVSSHSVLGTVGTSGNAKGKPPHLHYTLVTLVPYPWRIDKSRQGWKKMFYLDPIPLLNESIR